MQKHLILLEKEYDLLKNDCQKTTNQNLNPENEKIWALLAMLKALQLNMFDFLLHEYGNKFMEYQDPIQVPNKLIAKNIESQNCTLILKYGLFNEFTYKKFI